MSDAVLSYRGLTVRAPLLDFLARRAQAGPDPLSLALEAKAPPRRAHCAAVR